MNILDANCVFVTSDVPEARRRNSELLRPHTLHPVPGPDPFRATHHLARWSALSVHRLTFGAAVEVASLDTAGASSFLTVLPLRGTARVTIAGAAGSAEPGGPGDRNAVVINPRARFRSRWASGCGALIVRVDAPALQHHLERLIQRQLGPELAFDRRTGTRGADAAWWRLVHACISVPAGTEDPLFRAPLSTAIEHMLMTALLCTHRHNYSEDVQAAVGLSLPVHVRAAAALVRQDPSQVSGVRDIAEAAGVSVRTLQENFARHLHTTPSVYLRQARLWQARADLLSADSNRRGLVTEVGTRWGFTNLGRFAREYRDEFGESPSHTVARGIVGANRAGADSGGAAAG